MAQRVEFVRGFRRTLPIGKFLCAVAVLFLSLMVVPICTVWAQQPPTGAAPVLPAGPKAQLADRPKLDGQWEKLKISVCWEPMDKGEQAGDVEVARKWARDQVNRTWARHADIEFEGWSGCNVGSEGVRVLLDRKVFLYAATTGRYLDGMQNGVIIGVGPSNLWLRRCAPDGEYDRNYEKCFRWQITHMFGHVLGLPHTAVPTDSFVSALCEFSNDTPGRPQASDVGVTGAVVGDGTRNARPPSAPDSVMAPCPSVRTMRGASIKLTRMDIASLRLYYLKRSGD